MSLMILIIHEEIRKTITYFEKCRFTAGTWSVAVKKFHAKHFAGLRIHGWHYNYYLLAFMKLIIVSPSFKRQQTLRFRSCRWFYARYFSVWRLRGLYLMWGKIESKIASVWEVEISFWGRLVSIMDIIVLVPKVNLLYGLKFFSLLCCLDT